MIRSKQPRKKLSPKKYTELKIYISERDKWCLNCGTTQMPTPAHIKRRSEGGHDAPNNMIVLCQPCHTAFDAYQIELPESVYEMLANEPEQL